jgi:hypothetical protein
VRRNDGRRRAVAPSEPREATPTTQPREELEAVEELRAEPEPGWADAIRRGRRDRAERLRSVFASFDDDGEVIAVPIDDTAREHPEA